MVALEAKVAASVQDFVVLPRVGSAWMDKAIRLATGLQDALSIPSDVEERYQILSYWPVDVPPTLFEYLRVQSGLHFAVASSSLLVRRRYSRGDRGLGEIRDPKSFKDALSDLNALVSLLS